MIAKGLDLPLVTLVGVVSADTALHLPDYRAPERTFQLLTQVAGRAGRSHRGGQVIVQTYNPSHYAIQAAAHHDYAGFYRQELAYRRQLGYPPFSRLVALRLSDTDAHRSRAEAERLGRWLAAEIRQLHLVADLIGPAPCFFSRVEGRYRWQIVVRSPDPLPLLRDVALPWGWRVDVDPVSLL
jgi:primosomal protein N' (replication factor Y)